MNNPGSSQDGLTEASAAAPVDPHPLPPCGEATSVAADLQHASVYVLLKMGGEAVKAFACRGAGSPDYDIPWTQEFARMRSHCGWPRYFDAGPYILCRARV